MVDRCICHNVTFSRIAELAAQGLSLDEIALKTRCCTGCGMCEPYVKVVVATGRDRLPVMSLPQAEEVVRQAEAWKAASRRAASAESSKPPAGA